MNCEKNERGKIKETKINDISKSYKEQASRGRILRF